MKTTTYKVPVSLMLGMGISIASVSLPAAEVSESEMSALHQEINSLKKGQAAISKDLAEIKKLLKPKPKPKTIEKVEMVMTVTDDPFLGDPKAPLTLIEMTDYQCPFCSRHVVKTMPEIVKNYVDTGKVKYVNRDFPLSFHKDASKAAEAAHCAGEQGKYWDMHAKLFANQKAQGVDKLAEYAGNIGLDSTAFDTCLSSGKYAAKIQQSMKDGRKAGVMGTPTVLLGTTQDDGTVKITKRLRGAQPFSVFKTHIDSALAAEQKSNDGGRNKPAESK